MKRTSLLLLLISLLSVPAAGQASEELWISNGGRNIYGVLSKPSNTGAKQPVAIISHGFKPEEQALSLREIKAFLQGLDD